MNKKYLSYEEAVKKLQNYCAYQERCQEEVRSKLIELGVYGEELDCVIADLIEENYLNEQRFAVCFAGGKFRIKHWGRKKIVQELKAKKISDYSIRKALESEISEADYNNTLLDVLKKKANLLSEKDPYKRKQKLVQYAMSRGFETELVLEILKEMNSV